MKNKGFTLIEIIAVIIILGIIMIIAIPNISSYIANSRVDTYVVSLNRYIEGARNVVETGDIKINSTSITYYIPMACISVDKGQASPYGDWKDIYVAVTYDGAKHDYYITATDTAHHGVDLVYSDKFDSSKIRLGKTSVATNIAVGTRNTIKVLGADCDTSKATQYQGSQIKGRIADKA